MIKKSPKQVRPVSTAPVIVAPIPVLPTAARTDLAVAEFPYAALWVNVGAAEELEALQFTSCLLTRPYSVELTANCQATLEALRERLKTRERELTELEAFEQCRVPTGPNGEPDDLF
jgi:hypothetical protein